MEEIEVDEEEIKAHIEQVVAQWGVRADKMRASLNADEGRDTVTRYLLAQKAVQRLVAIAKGEAPEPVSKDAEEQE